MEGFPPICKQDPLDVQLFYIHDHLQRTREEIQLEDIPEESYGGTVKVAKSRKAKRKPLTEAEYLEEASEQPAKKAKKAKKDKASEATGSEVATIQEEVEDLEADKILPERTKSGKAATTSQSAHKQPSIQKRKRKHVVRKLKESKYVEDEEQVAEATQLVTREVRKKKVNDDVVQRALELTKHIEVPASSIAREDAAEAAQEVIKAAEVVQELAATEAEGLALVTSEEAQEGNTAALEASGSPEAPEGMSETLHTDVEIVKLGSRSSSDIRSNSPSSSSTTSSDPDDIHLSKVYTTLNKALTPSPSTKTTKKPKYDTSVPMYLSVEERLIGMQQRRIDACKNLSADHPLQPPAIEPIQFIPAAAEGESDCVGIDLANTIVSSTPNSPTTQTTEILEPSIIPNLESHYSGEPPEYVSNSQIASNIAFDEVMTECPPQHEPNQEMATTTNIDFVLIHEILVPELTVPKQTASEQSVSELTTNSQSTTTNTQIDHETSTHDQPSSLNLVIQHVAPTKTNVPSPPTLFLHSTILSNLCDIIF